MPEIILIAHNIRSTHNVGALFRTAEGFGIKKIILSGYTPYPLLEHDTRLPHEAAKLHKQIHKTALGAETMVPFEYAPAAPLYALQQSGYRIVGLEQSPRSISLSQYEPPKKLALLLGEEVEGIPEPLLSECEDILEIPMFGKKESFNVSVAAGIAMYELARK
jgi:23S rRNA (guanosine2251-2'-O)-methyltransferase